MDFETNKASGWRQGTGIALPRFVAQVTAMVGMAGTLHNPHRPIPCSRSTARTRSSGIASTVRPRPVTVVAMNSEL